MSGRVEGRRGGNESVERRLAEIAPLVGGDTVLDAIAVALAVEDTFGIVLDDADLTPERLCTPAALAAVVNDYLDGV